MIPGDTSIKVLLGLGSNMGDREDKLKRALAGIESLGLRIDRVSRVYESPPWGNTDQDTFYNLVAAGHTSEEPESLMQALLKLEESLGRVRYEKWGPRSIDIDILDWGGEELITPRLQVPHPYMQERAFVLIPLAEIAPDYVHPTLGMGVFEMLDELSEEEKSGILPLKNL